MAAKRAKLPGRGGAPKPIETVVGRHPILKNIHRLTRYDNGQIQIERDDYITTNPRTGAQERTSFPVLTEEFTHHQWLWYFITQNPV